MSRTPRWYASLRSPYSWLALERGIASRSPLLEAATMHIFFEPGAEIKQFLDERAITFHYTPMSRAKHLYILRDVRRLASRLGVAITWPDDSAANWEITAAACAGVLAQDQARGKQLVLELSRARWTRGADLNNAEQVATLLNDGGFPRDLATLHSRPEGRQLLVSVAERMDEDGVFGVPFFRVGRESFWGLERLEEAEKHHCSSSAPWESDGSVLGRGFDDDHAGGCG
ncbi:hypothetical protein HMPREF1531_00988 [Propionibacterium sp. oral taxon 192 str. F0372]|uniref:DsbA family protein n=1 Tax=Propionibacterium sp. oral taxon 192 TaxID=671222 RepID=UPI0003540AE3|nr:DsbA family protein [Propionibacterium sp. oral taxon 192]EPH05559.1 hypothetical protein HMPREF1531_00988 [Propionibacterium sp. oral taxon 192 str. F0372]